MSELGISHRGASTRLWLCLAAACVALFAACTSGGGAATDHLEPPRRMSGPEAPQLDVPMTPSGRASVRVTIEVLIDSLGRPDMGAGPSSLMLTTSLLPSAEKHRSRRV